MKCQIAAIARESSRVASVSIKSTNREEKKKNRRGEEGNRKNKPPNTVCLETLVEIVAWRKMERRYTTETNDTSLHLWEPE